jgi:hypothetical protein
MEGEVGRGRGENKKGTRMEDNVCRGGRGENKKGRGWKTQLVGGRAQYKERKR